MKPEEHYLDAVCNALKTSLNNLHESMQEIRGMISNESTVTDESKKDETP